MGSGFRRWAERRASRRGRRGVTAVEYGLLAVPFTFGLLFFVDIAFRFYVQEALDLATETAYRLVQRGKVPSAARTRDGFMTNVFCPALGPMLSCANVTLSMGPVNDWRHQAAISVPPAPGAAGAAASAFCFGAAGVPMLMRATLASPTLVLGLFAGQNNPVPPVTSLGAFVYQPSTQYGAASCS